MRLRKRVADASQCRSFREQRNDRGADGKIDESRATIEKASALHVFTADFPIPPNALHDAAAIERTFRSLQE